MSKVTVQIGFYLEGEHYAQMQAFLPKIQAQKISQLKIDQRLSHLKLPQTRPKKGLGRTGKIELSKSEKSSSKRAQSQDEQIQDQEDNINEMQNEQEAEQQFEEEDQIMDEEQIDEEKVDSEKEEENLLRYLEDQEDSDDDDLEDDDDDISSISRSMSVIRSNHKTKRQKGERGGLMELPDRRPRKDKKLDQATQIIRRQEKQRKRKQYLKKQVEAQEKATLDKILNQTGRKLKLREEKQNQEEKKKEQKLVKSIGGTSKITLVDNNQGPLIILYKAQLFPEQMTRAPQIKPKHLCSKCNLQEGRYRIKNTQKFACSLNCYKVLV